MGQYVLEGNNMTTLERAYDELETVFHLPDYFGRNLDALEECLGDLAEEEGTLSVIVQNSKVVEQTLPEWESLMEIFLGNPYISLTEE